MSLFWNPVLGWKVLKVIASYSISHLLWSWIHSEYIVSAGRKLLFLCPHRTFLLGKRRIFSPASGWAVHLCSWFKSVPYSSYKLLSFSKKICVSVSIHRVGVCQQQNAQAWLLAGHCCIGLCQDYRLPFALLPSVASLCHLGFLMLIGFQIVAFNYDEKAILSHTSPCFSVCSCFLLYSSACNYRAGSDAVQWLRWKAAQCLQFIGCNNLFERPSMSVSRVPKNDLQMEIWGVPAAVSMWQLCEWLRETSRSWFPQHVRFSVRADQS